MVKFKYALKGLWIGLSNKSIQLQIMLAIIVSIIYAFIGISMQEWIIVIALILLVILAEWLNTLIEKLVDYISLSKNKQAGDIKDMASGLVLLVCISAAIIGLIILFNNI
ncbi:MAG: diacylglycerol kinase [Erysipelotrichaceae bacterium]